MGVIPICPGLVNLEGVDLSFSGFYGTLCDFTGTVFKWGSPDNKNERNILISNLNWEKVKRLKNISVHFIISNWNHHL